MTTTEYKRDEIKQHAVDMLEDLKGSSIHGCDLHNEIYNTDYYIIGTYEAKQWLGDMAFDVIETIKDYEQNNFGQVSTDLSDPEKVVNMYAYIVGEEVLGESEHLRKTWDRILDHEDLKAIKKELKGKGGSMSANTCGKDYPHAFAEVEDRFGYVFRVCPCGYKERLVANGPDDCEWEEVEA